LGDGIVCGVDQDITSVWHVQDFQVVVELGGGSGPQFVGTFRDAGTIWFVLFPWKLDGKADEVSV
tara:strand:- start:102293 stop:102487 length:195 start_codon:yes stop_codon:yes gene_type:complete